MLHQPGASKFIKLMSDHHNRITRINPTTDLESTMSLGGALPGKEEPPDHGEKLEESGDSLPSPWNCMPHHIAGMAGQQWDE